MLSLFGRGTKLCDGITRREMLRVGGFAICGLTLADVLRGQANAGSESKSKSKSVVLSEEGARTAQELFNKFCAS